MLFERNFVTIVNSINYRSVLLFFFENEQVISLLYKLFKKIIFGGK